MVSKPHQQLQDLEQEEVDKSRLKREAGKELRQVLNQLADAHHDLLQACTRLIEADLNEWHAWSRLQVATDLDEAESNLQDASAEYDEALFNYFVRQSIFDGTKLQARKAQTAYNLACIKRDGTRYYLQECQERAAPSREQVAAD